MLSRTHRFNGLNALNFAHKRGKVQRGGSFSIKYVLNDRRDTYRVAVVVSKKVSKSAVVRNRIRRRVFEVARLELTDLKQPYDIIFMIYDAEMAIMPVNRLQQMVKAQLNRTGMV